MLSIVSASYETDWRVALGKALPDAASATLEKASLGRGCESGEAALAPVCGPWRRVRRIRILMISTAAIAIIFTSLLLLAGWKCQTDGALLLRVFRPALRVTTALVILMIVSWGIGKLAGLWYGGTVLLHTVAFKMMAVVALALLRRFWVLSAPAWASHMRLRCTLWRVLSRLGKRRASGLWCKSCAP